MVKNARRKNPTDDDGDFVHPVVFVRESAHGGFDKRVGLVPRRSVALGKTEGDVVYLEEYQQRLPSETVIEPVFVNPGRTEGSARADLCRTVARRRSPRHFDTAPDDQFTRVYEGGIRGQFTIFNSFAYEKRGSSWLIRERQIEFVPPEQRLPFRVPLFPRSLPSRLVRDKIS